MNDEQHRLAATHDAVEPLLAEHALGTLDAADRPRVDAHLLECAGCRRTFDELCAGVAAMEIAVASRADARVPEADRAALLAAAARTPQSMPASARASASAPSAPRRSPRSRWRRNTAAAWLAAGAATCACIVLVFSLDARQGRIDRLERQLDRAKGSQVAVLRGASIGDFDTGGPFGDVRAQVVLRPDAGVIAFRHVPAPPDGLVWQVWAITSDERIHSLGIIDRAQGSAFLTVDDVDPEEVERIIVTTEPAGGSTEPTAKEVAEATV